MSITSSNIDTNNTIKLTTDSALALNSSNQAKSSPFINGNVDSLSTNSLAKYDKPESSTTSSITTHIPSILCHSSHQSSLSPPATITSQNDLLKVKEEKQGDRPNVLTTVYNNAAVNSPPKQIQTDIHKLTNNLSESSNEFKSKPILMTNCTTLPSSIFSTIPINGLNPIKQATVHVVYSSKPIPAFKSNDPSISTTPTNTTPKQKQSQHEFYNLVNEVKNKLNDGDKLKSMIINTPLNTSVASLNIPSIQSHQSNTASSPFINTANAISSSSSSSLLETPTKNEIEYSTANTNSIDQNKSVKRKRSSDSNSKIGSGSEFSSDSDDDEEYNSTKKRKSNDSLSTKHRSKISKYHHYNDSFSQSQGQSQGQTQQLYCICNKPYDGRFYHINCSECHNWYHGKCVNVTPSMGSNIIQYICPSCHERTGKETILQDQTSNSTSSSNNNNNNNNSNNKDTSSSSSSSNNNNQIQIPEIPLDACPICKDLCPSIQSAIMCCICKRYTHSKCIGNSNREIINDREYICNICEITEEGKKRKEEITKRMSIYNTPTNNNNTSSSSSLLLNNNNNNTNSISSASSLASSSNQNRKNSLSFADLSPSTLRLSKIYEDPLMSLIYFSEEPTLFLDHYIAVYNGSDTWKIAKIEKYNGYHKRYHAKVEGDKTQWIRLDNSDIWRFIPTVTAMKVERKNQQSRHLIIRKEDLLSPFTSSGTPEDLNKYYVYSPLSLDDECIGDSLCILKAEKLWFPAVVEEYDSFTKNHMVRYDNGEIEWIHSTHKTKLPPKLCVEAALNMKMKLFEPDTFESKKHDTSFLHLPYKMSIKRKRN